MKKKGFTLVELLAVIVILAVIALIAVPLVLNSIEEARKGAFEQSLNNVVRASQLYQAGEELDEPIVDCRYFSFENDVTEKTERNGKMYYPSKELDLKGDVPTKGEAMICSEEIMVQLSDGDYVGRYDGNNTFITDYSEDELDEEGKVQIDLIYNKAKKFVYNDAGHCKTDDDSTDTTTYKYMGGCYIKGTSETNVAAASNYVWYNGFMWRIMGINSDGTVRLITDENVTTLAYGAENTANGYLTNEGYIHDWLNEYFYNNLNNTKDIIKTGAYFCSELGDSSDYVLKNECPTGRTVTAPIGIISLDEYLLSKGDSTSYLKNSQKFWTMTPTDIGTAAYIDYTGINQAFNNDRFYGIRPIINVNPKATVTSGDGTATKHYVLEQVKRGNMKGKLSDTVTSGEYVSLEGKTYRVVRKTDEGIKLVLDGFYKENDSIVTVIYGDSAEFNTTSGIGAKLNGDVLNWLGLFGSDKIITNATWNQGNGFGLGTNYMTTLNIGGSEDDVVTAAVGLIQVGDILAGQSSTMITNNYTSSYGSSKTKSYWTMNKHTSGDSAWQVNNTGNSAYSGVNSVSEDTGLPTNVIRPVIVVKSDLNITGGNGTWSSPYEI